MHQRRKWEYSLRMQTEPYDLSGNEDEPMGLEVSVDDCAPIAHGRTGTLVELAHRYGTFPQYLKS
jgi:hypothetical protein